MNLRSFLLPALLSVLVPCTASSQQAANSDEEISDDLMRALENAALATLSFAETVRPAIDRSAFDQDALLDRLDFDDGDIVRFVAEQIAYEPYAGLLRGAHGTLLARAGNALDQSLLLATLLNDAGFEAVIRGGTLTSDEAERLLNVMAERPEFPAELDASVDEAALEASATALFDSLGAWNQAEDEAGRVAPFTMEQVRESILLDRDALLAALDEAGVALGDPGAAANLVADTTEYYWVEYRDGPASAWNAVHPAFGTASAPAIEIGATYAGDIPAELTHRIRVELVVDQRSGEAISTAALMDPMEFPSANVAGQSILLSLYPDALFRTEPADEETTPERETRFLLPIVNGGLPAGAQALALNGTLVPPDLIQYSQAGVFETVGERFESAANALSGLGETDDTPADLMAIEALRLQITLISPNNGEQTVERFLYLAPGETIFENEPDAAARRAALVAELARSHSLGFVVGALSDAYVADEQFAELERLGPLIRALADPALDACESLDCLPEPELSPNPSGSNTALIAAFFDDEMPLDDDAIIYRDAPNVFRLSQPFFSESTPLPGLFDIMANSRRGFRLSDGASLPSPDLVLLAGVADTHLERVAPGSVALESTIERRPGQTSEIPLITRATNDDVVASGTSEGRMMRDAQAAGSVVVTTDVEDWMSGALFGWWEVDPVTGRTVGMARFGGITAVEAVVLGVLVVSGGVVIYCKFTDSRSPTITRMYAVERFGRPRQARVERAGCLSNTVCFTWALAWAPVDIVLSAGNMDEAGNRLQDRGRSCVTSLDGWELEAVHTAPQ